MALPLAMLALVVLAALIVGVFASARLEQGMGRNAMYAAQAAGAADVGVGAVVGGWSGLGLEALAPGESLALPGASLPELLTPTVPRLVLQGTLDTFGSADELTADLLAADAADEVVVVPLPGADHGFKTPAGAAFRPADLRALVVASTTRLIESVGSTVNTRARE